MSIFAKAQATAQRLIDKYGRTITLRRGNPGAYNPTSGGFSGASTVDHTVKAVFTNYNEAEIDGEIIQRDDMRVLIAGTKPEKDDILIDGSKKSTIVNVKETKPGDLAVLWEAQART